MDCITASLHHRITAHVRLAWLAAAALALVLGGCSSTQQAPESDRSTARPGKPQAAPQGSGKTEVEIGESAAQNALAMRGKPYRYGGYTPQGFDCSGLIFYSYSQAGGQVPRNTNGLWARSRSIDRGEIRPGDLLFFHQEGKRNSHVAIYIGSNRFVHAPSSGKQVSTASLSDKYWRQHFSAARRPVL